MNVTLGALWVLNTHLTLGVAVDFPWTAQARLKKTVKHTQTTYDESRTRVLNTNETYETQSKDVEFTFPPYWAVGLAVKWNNRLYSMCAI